jgi:hypothetical protein
MILLSGILHVLLLLLLMMIARVRELPRHPRRRD